MKPFARLFLVTLLMFLSTILLSSCGEKDQAEVIKIGYAGALSGDVASYGIPSKRATELVVQKINEQGGLLGKQVVLVAEDDMCKPEVATNTATKLAIEGVKAVIGHSCSGATISALGIYKETNIVSISPASTKPEITQSGDYPFFFRTTAPDDSQAKLQVDFALNTLGLKKIVVLHDRGDYGRGLAEFIKRFIIESGKAEVILFEGITAGAVDYTAIVQKIDLSNADGVVYGGNHPEASKLVMQMRNNGMDIPFISGDGVKDDAFIRVAGAFSEGVYATGAMDVSTNPMAIAAVEEHRIAYDGEEPGAFFLNGYAAALVLMNAIEKAGSTETPAIIKALRTEYVDTPLGKISFDAKGDAIGVGFAVYQVQNGHYIELKPGMNQDNEALIPEPISPKTAQPESAQLKSEQAPSTP